MGGRIGKKLPGPLPLRRVVTRAPVRVVRSEQRVFIIEESEFVRPSLVANFRVLGHEEVDEYTDLASAEAALESHEPQIIILLDTKDWQVRRSFIGKVREKYGDNPVIVIVSENLVDLEDAKRRFGQSVDGIFTKPYSMPWLNDAINKAVEARFGVKLDTEVEVRKWQNTGIVQNSNPLFYFQGLRARTGVCLGEGEEKVIYELDHPLQKPLVVGFVKPREDRPLGYDRPHNHYCFYAQRIAHLLFPENFPNIYLAGAVENQKEEGRDRIEELRGMPYRSRTPGLESYRPPLAFSSFFVVDQLEMWEGQRVIEDYLYALADYHLAYPNGPTTRKVVAASLALYTGDYKEAKRRVDTYFRPLLKQVKAVGITPQSRDNNATFRPDSDVPVFIEVLTGLDIKTRQVEAAVAAGKTRELKGEDKDAFDFYMYHMYQMRLRSSPEYKTVGTEEMLVWLV